MLSDKKLIMHRFWTVFNVFIVQPLDYGVCLYRRSHLAGDKIITTRESVIASKVSNGEMSIWEVVTLYPDRLDIKGGGLLNGGVFYPQIIATNTFHKHYIVKRLPLRARTNYTVLTTLG